MTDFDNLGANSESITQDPNIYYDIVTKSPINLSCKTHD